MTPPPGEPAFVADGALARWTAQLAPVVASEAITAWLDAGQPEPALAADGSGRRS